MGRRGILPRSCNTDRVPRTGRPLRRWRNRCSTSRRPSDLLSRMGCRVKRPVRKARRAADIASIGKPSNAADGPFDSNPKGRGRFGSRSRQMRALLLLTIVALLLRIRALNQTQIAPRRIRILKSHSLVGRIIA